MLASVALFDAARDRLAWPGRLLQPDYYRQAAQPPLKPIRLAVPMRG